VTTAATSRLSGTDLRSVHPVHPEIVEVSMRSFLAVDGHGVPGSAEYRQAVIALQTVSEAARAVIEHRGRLPVHQVQPLETLWTVPSGHPNDGSWSWTALIEQPAGVTSDIVVVSRIKAARSMPGDVLGRLRWWHWREGRSAQLLHPGPFRPADLAQRRLDDFIAASGSRPRGRYHELHLSYPQGGDPAREWTVLRRQIGP
jgi:hypothetical protein